ncbi:MAG: leucine-rich repeat domain-containing protein, partial [Clostridiales bacterium]|nr:leucine-rich repeat domain-containing protein [Clostridiales bacterium]
MKKLLALILAAVFLLCLTACGGGGDNRPPKDLAETPASDFTYEYKAELGGMVITSYKGSSTKVRIPEKIEGKPVIRIDNAAFKNSGITYVYIPNSVTEIGGGAFYGCKGLASVTIPKSVKSIDNAYAERSAHADIASALGGFAEPTSVATGNSVTAIADADDELPVEYVYYGVFDDCTGLESVIIADGVTKIGDYAFRGCTKLTDITIPGSVTSIGEMAFYDCTGLTGVIIPNSVTSIGRYAFSGCSGLTDITIPGSVTEIGFGAFVRCIGLTSVTIDDGVAKIGDYAFAFCTGL